MPIFLQTPDANKEYRQTEVSQEVSSDVLNILEIAKKDIIKLQMEKEVSSVLECLTSLV